MPREDQGRLDIYLQEEGERERMGTKTKTPTVDDWTAELARLTRDDPGETCEELARRAGIPVETMRHTLARGVAAGRYIKGRARRNGRPVYVYRIAKGGTK